MKPRGQVLFELWRDSMNEQGIDVGEWTDLEKSEETAWLYVGDNS